VHYFLNEKDAEDYKTQKYSKSKRKSQSYFRRHEERNSSEEEYFKPEINKKSKRLDIKNQNLSRFDRLYELSKLKKEEIEKKRIQKIEEEIEREEELLKKHKKKVF
jgi:hypothetical protein